MQQLKKEQLHLIAGGMAQTSTSEALGIATAIGAGYGAHVAIEAAGGLAAMGATAGIAAASAGAGGIAASGIGAWKVGSFLYENSETVRDVSQGAVGLAFDYARGFGEYYSGIGATSCTYAGGGGLHSYETEHALF